MDALADERAVGRARRARRGREREQGNHEGDAAGEPGAHGRQSNAAWVAAPRGVP